MTIAVDDVVTVVEEEDRHHGKQAKVAEIVNDGNPDGPIGLRFPEGTITRVFDDPEVFRYEEAELRVDTGWTPKNRAFWLFGRHVWHSLSPITEPFEAGGDCGHEDCPHHTVQRCMVNILGIACEVDLCGGHRDEYHGKSIEHFPWRKQRTAEAV